MASATVPASHLEEKPTILIIQDRFQTPAVYKDLVDRLVSLGYPTVHPLLPTCSDAQDPNFPFLTLLDDATAVQSELVRLVEHEQKTVMVVMHGYGGMVGSEAVLEDMSCNNRRRNGLSGGVIHLFFVCASLVGPGQSMLGGLDSPSSHKVEVHTLPFRCRYKLYIYLFLGRWPLHDHKRLIHLIQRPPTLRSTFMGIAPCPTSIHSPTDRAHTRGVQLHPLDLSHLRE